MLKDALAAGERTKHMCGRVLREEVCQGEAFNFLKIHKYETQKPEKKQHIICRGKGVIKGLTISHPERL